MIARVVRFAPLALSVVLAACAGPAPMSIPGLARAPSPSASGAGGLAGLVGGSNVISAQEAELRDLQRRPTAIAFPARVGVLFYDYTDPLKGEDHQAIISALGQEMVASGLVSVVAPIPNQVVRPGDSLDALRKLAARFQVDVLLIVSGAQEFQRSDSQPPQGWFTFTNSANYEARSTLTGLAIGVYSGTFLTPFQVVGKAEPQLLDPAAPDFDAGAYRIRKAAHEAALRRLKDAFVNGITLAKAAQDAAPPAPTATPGPVATASDEVPPTPEPAPTGTVQPLPATPTPSPSVTPSATPRP